VFAECADGALGPAELRVLDAITARLIPTDEMGPGAREALVSRYIGRALQGDYAAHLEEYRRGLAATDSYSTARFGRGFTDLTDVEQDAVLAAIERNEASQFEPSSGVFFARVRQHTIEGMFGDPSWGGNADKAGWSLIGYSGPQEVWSVDEQALEAIPAPQAADEES